MDTKEIINVNDCEFLWKEKLPKRVCNNGNLDCDCNSNPNCYFKQLKRKTQECEELYNEKMKLIDKSIEQKCKIRELIDENAIKEVVYKINGKCAKTVANKVEEIRKIVEGKDCKWSKYKQALDEIEEFCTVYSANHDAYETVYKDILAFINKAKDVE